MSEVSNQSYREAFDLFVSLFLAAQKTTKDKKSSRALALAIVTEVPYVQMVTQLQPIGLL